MCVVNEHVVLPARLSGANSPVDWKRKRCQGPEAPEDPSSVQSGINTKSSGK